MPVDPNEATAAPAALSAFLRGVERRGAVFAELQCGDRETGDTALAAALRAFRNHAGTLPMADWPTRFWTLLAAAPPLRQTSRLAHWPSGLQALSNIEPAFRQALLLRWVAGLPEDEAAAVLGVDRETYEHTLARACPRDVDGKPDAVAWRLLAETAQQQLRDLPPERLARLAALREAAITGVRRASVANEVPRDRPARRPAAAPVRVRRRWPWIALVALACAAALLATWWPRSERPSQAEAKQEHSIQRLQDEVRISREEIPLQQPAGRFDVVAALLLHPDFDLVMDSQEEAIASQADFLAWVASGADALPQAVDEPADASTTATPDAAQAKETSDAQL